VLARTRPGVAVDGSLIAVSGSLAGALTFWTGVRIDNGLE